MHSNPVQKVGQIGIPVKNIERATAFYQEKLGLPLLFNTDTMAFFDCEGVRLLLTLPENEQFAHPSSVIYLQVEDIKAKYEELLSGGVEFIGEPHVVAKIGDTETWMVFFKDTEENTHAFMSEVSA
ncbi:VOC family protein [Mesobacillus selenatarsenatis]|uniref:Glyoxalase/bleomycin resistance protein/dioxygenase n=1 Tax=Mesobacillus selenatarsenatis (strain DSM 18680 / JCM 14380 / FERM P-15431 / SF-1) TaxID=1321606 RepID=A0A0A8X5J0_MESS1|nr:VOC family protein [Mesobacillus selenatarsenatis]GAM15250.1 glyoxalase/bleomycin resistance protein/dioxygenase [Mesobacillus selenatarsenatis SF-1]